MESNFETYHFRQRHFWDCGVACLLMVYKSKNPLEETDIEGIYSFFMHTKKMVFTIDLYDFLKTWGWDASFTTIELGLADSHNELVKIFLHIPIGLLSKRRLELPQIEAQ